MPAPVPGWKPVNREHTAQPAEQPNAISRPRIVAQINAARSRARTILVIAPAGSGKTTACAEWARTQQHPVIWLTASRFDQSPFDLVRLIATAHRTHEHSSDAAPTRPPGSIREVATLLEENADSTTVVIDDLHRITSSDALAGLEELINSTVKTRFVLISRAAAAMDLTGGSALIDRTVLDFDSDELEQAISKADGAYSPEEIHALTGGWAAGSILLLNQPEQDPATQYQLASLFDRTLDQLPVDLQDFVAATSITSTFDVDLAAALTGQQNANDIADACVRAGLLIDVFHDGLETKYRWHDLFAEHCRRRVLQQDPARYRELNAIAARSLAMSRPHEAIDHAIRAQDLEFALEVIRNSWLSLVLEGQASTLDSICQRLPAELAADPFVIALRACCAAIVGDELKAVILRERAEHLDTEHAREVGLVSEVAVLLTAHSAGMLRSACDALQYRLRTEPIPANTAVGLLFLIGWTELRLRRESGGAARFLRSAFREASAQGLTRIARHAAANLSFALAYDGQFTEAQHTLGQLDAIPSDEWETYDGGLEDFCRGFIAYWQSDLQTARTKFLAARAHGDGSLPYGALASVFEAFTAAESRDANDIADAATRVTRIDTKETHGLPWSAYTRLAQALLAYAAGRRDIAKSVAQTIPLDVSTPTVLVKLANLYRHLGLTAEFEHALQVLSSRLDHPRYVAVSAGLARSLAAFQSNRDRAAHIELEHALDLAEPEKIALPFSIHDPAVRSALELHAKWGSRHETWIGQLLTGHDTNSEAAAHLTPKEREILNLLRTSMTATEIAEALYVSLNTIKTHQRSIYRKLGVTTRRQAIKIRI
ncbi:LuxR C-terminal-related transcriptional regulator [Agromyces sp. S2-1-8]|uniref:helix-turn-helix transcriptional regulator n=1 Tax=Agromyces sp. S2-1-8 TaxID=2897180 RepID=UPI001E51CCB0|nr:LuxR C-terminal-related transcriptional regulator [Agromyces sp. S2-1-8]MCD5348390.1 LuxR C-terminal-related transcriptional regulator [Agromyces sp. S2-1-8]